MPSRAYKVLTGTLLKNVDRLIHTHALLNEWNHNGVKGRRYLGHITRSGVVTLCAAWERYMELVPVETAEYILERIPSPHRLPRETQKHLVRFAKENK